jgi:hypothetical protein
MMKHTVLKARNQMVESMYKYFESDWGLQQLREVKKMTLKKMALK